MSSNVRYTYHRKRTAQRKRLRSIYTRCPKCGVLLDWDHPYLPNSAEVDEIYPISKLPVEFRAKAAIDPHNLQALCRKCNKEKSNKTPKQLAAIAAAMAVKDMSQNIETSTEY